MCFENCEGVFKVVHTSNEVQISYVPAWVVKDVWLTNKQAAECSKALSLIKQAHRNTLHKTITWKKALDDHGSSIKLNPGSLVMAYIYQGLKNLTNVFTLGRTKAVQWNAKKFSGQFPWASTITIQDTYAVHLLTRANREKGTMNKSNVSPTTGNSNSVYETPRN
ncbi:unnamed protein product [Lepeophtheirus salmonis]|uniref:(salmon louse) hypothetical protein n=1 Tax=Lepeophtheirus salmonis TaxID=72036 RepID=A0A7R8CXI7_LEPSM|nr:unnamed protein product [Lepeophtheirus salmonis]CAF2960591.1 unnamed protein product [Lepeophtheirus salmonis]